MLINRYTNRITILVHGNGGADIPGRSIATPESVITGHYCAPGYDQGGQ